MGDFDVPVTKCIMVHTEEHSRIDLLNTFYVLMNIKSEKGNSNLMLNKLTDEFIVFLESKGFTKLQTETVLFSD